MPIIPIDRKIKFESQAANKGGKISEYPKDKQIE
jgi:hypothetical protein